ncbi:hypothetical protein [Metapseudomonas otitidis]|uniref:hypothetical protein n=1 Tax=Metapseudomonas otitidis TaxID=319939 RepID=UPI0008E13A02|nr:hypothetical protein [Pseudomonas otitidis]SFA63454.1 hypothetical protein SAMN05216263_112201 [Pseudomonas otitidis]
MNTLPIVLDQHAEEAGFLAGLRDYAVFPSQYRLERVPSALLLTADNRTLNPGASLHRCGAD